MVSLAYMPSWIFLSVLPPYIIIRWQDSIINMKMLQRANITSINGHSPADSTTVGSYTQLRWVTRINNNRLPKAVLYGKLCTGKRGRGASCKRFKDSLKKFPSVWYIDARCGKHRLQTCLVTPFQKCNRSFCTSTQSQHRGENKEKNKT